MKTPSFLWGVAHSAFQVEGSPADSDWRRWTRESGRVQGASTAQLCTDFWNQYERDLDWVTELGANAFRFSLAWERLEPREGNFDDEAFARYALILAACHRRGIAPIVTLVHFTLPGWLVDRGGLLDPAFARRFEIYVSEVQRRLGKYLHYVITINEPMVQVSFGYLSGIWPPGLKAKGRSASIAAKHLALAHARAYTALKVLNPSLKVSVAMHWRIFDARRGWNPLDRIMMRLANKFFNASFTQAILSRKSSFSALGSAPEEFLFPGDGPLIDFLGVNYYGRMMVSISFKPPFIRVEENPRAEKKTDLGWEVYPQGLQRMLAEWKNLAPHIPIMVTENGAADATDRVRSDFITSHITALGRAASDLDLQVLGYIHWSLTDNFEWSEGLAPKFGLIGVTYPESGDARELKFEKRPAFFTYQRLIRDSATR